MSASRMSWTAAGARHVALLMSSAFVLAPFLWMVSLSLKSPGEIFSASFSFIPLHWSAAENYGKALTAVPLPRYMLNGVLVCFAILVLQIFVSAPAAYALAKLRFRGRSIVFGLVLVGLLLPHQVLALPLFILGYQVGILDTYAALIFPFAVSPFGIFLFRQFFRSIPDDVVHAARLDGMPEFSIVWRVMMPMALPAILAFAIFSIVAHWNDLFWPLIAVRQPDLMPPALGITTFSNDERGTDFGPLMAAAIMVVTPLIVAFLAAQKWFVEGLAAGSVK